MVKILADRVSPGKSMVSERGGVGFKLLQAAIPASLKRNFGQRIVYFRKRLWRIRQFPKQRHCFVPGPKATKAGGRFRFHGFTGNPEAGRARGIANERASMNLATPDDMGSGTENVTHGSRTLQTD
jgi:hypothetical protein